MSDKNWICAKIKPFCEFLVHLYVDWAYCPGLQIDFGNLKKETY